jgi:hypothetical protein
VKITLNGEVFEYDGTKPKVSEALVIEEAYGRRYVEWQDDLSSGGAKAMCTLAWLIWRQAGRDVDLAGILDDTVPLDLHEMIQSVLESAAAAVQAAGEEGSAGPTIPAGSPDPDGTHTTGTGISSSSPANSTSARGKSPSSKSRTSKR